MLLLITTAMMTMLMLKMSWRVRRMSESLGSGGPTGSPLGGEALGQEQQPRGVDPPQEGSDARDAASVARGAPSISAPDWMLFARRLGGWRGLRS
ncbi:unnamed protein product [Lampetra fluviatilis]